LLDDLDKNHVPIGSITGLRVSPATLYALLIPVEADDLGYLASL